MPTSFGQRGELWLTQDSVSIDPPYPVYGGLFQKEAVMLLRRFYIQENERGQSLNYGARQRASANIPPVAPNPRPKKNRELNTGFGDEQNLPPIS